MDRLSERGLSTLEWILLVAAVGGLATIGVLVVRGAVGETDDRTQTQAELAGESGALQVLQGKVNQVMSRLRNIRNAGIDEDRFNVCLGNVTDGDSTHGAQRHLFTYHMRPLQAAHSELYSFHPVSVSLDTAQKFPMLEQGDLKFVWCRVRSKVSGVCASIADETPVSNPPNTGYRDINLIRDKNVNFKRVTPPSARHNYPLSNTFCNGRV